MSCLVCLVRVFRVFTRDNVFLQKVFISGKKIVDTWFIFV